MKIFTFSVTIISFLLYLNSVSGQIKNNQLHNMGSILVKVTGLPNDRGECWVAIDNSKIIYESEDSVYIGRILSIKNQEVNLKIDSLPFGNYAVKVFHDENSNGELDTNFLVIPTEDYGYSNNVSAWFGPPSLERAMFSFNQNVITINISLD